MPTVSAASARIEGNVKLGPSRRHLLFVVGVPVIAVLLLASGLFLAVETFDVNQTRGASLDLTPDNGALAFATPIDKIGALASAAAVTVQLTGCGTRNTASGVVLDDRTVLASRSQVLTDATPLIQTADGTVVRGVVVGWNVPRDLAVIRTEEPLPSGLTWGVSTRLREGIEVFVADISDPTNVAVAEVKVDQVRSRDGIAVRMDFESTAPSPSPVFDSDGLVIGITSKPGQAEPANAVRGYVSRAIVDDRRPNAICPPPPPTTVPATDQAPTDG